MEIPSRFWHRGYGAARSGRRAVKRLLSGSRGAAEKRKLPGSEDGGALRACRHACGANAPQSSGGFAAGTCAPGLRIRTRSLDAAAPVYAAALFTNGLYRPKNFMFPETASAAGAATLPADLSAPRKGCPSAAAPADTPEWPGSPAAAAPPRSAPDYGILRPKH